MNLWALWMYHYYCTVKKTCMRSCEVIWTLTRHSSWFWMLSAGCVCWKCVLWSTATLFWAMVVCMLSCGGSCGTNVIHAKKKTKTREITSQSKILRILASRGWIYVSSFLLKWLFCESEYADHTPLIRTISYAKQWAEEQKQAKVIGMLVFILQIKLIFSLELTVK